METCDGPGFPFSPLQCRQGRTIAMETYVDLRGD